MAFIIVQHLAPNHDSMMVDLLKSHTAMPVMQASDGMIIERDHVYAIPPGVYLSVDRRRIALRRPRPATASGCPSTSSSIPSRTLLVPALRRHPFRQARTAASD